MHWAAKYVGMKHVPGGRGPEAVDCWGLLRMAYRDRFGIELPELPGVTVGSLYQSVAVVQREFPSWEEVGEPFDGAAVAMSQRKAIHHVGIYVQTPQDGGRILHCWDSYNVIVDTVARIRLKGFLVIKYYRHKLWPT
jgi:cell wall-associated NlpC family hydrolase